MWGKGRLVKLSLAVLTGVMTLAVALISVYMMWEQAPTLPTPAAAAEQVDVSMPEDNAETGKKSEKGIPFNTSRRDGMYTILLVGNDDGTGNTDTIMVGKIDTVRHTMNFVSIPRDTIINTDWACRKLNSVYWGAENHGNSGIEALQRHVKKLVGFDLDCYAVVELDAFQQIVDAMGGVWFDVPQDMYYEDAGQNLYIDLQSGYQLLDGYQAMCLCRYRSSYVDGDIGRISVQHDFLKALAEQFVTDGSIPNAAEVCDIIAENTTTNLSAANIAYFFRQALMCKSEDINFYTAPHTPAYVQNLSYAFLDLYDWIDMVNECINPFSTPVTEANLDLVYLHNGNVCCTTVLNDPGYYDLGRSKGGEEPAEEYTEETWDEPSVEEEVPAEEAPEYTPAAPDDNGDEYVEIFPDAEPEEDKKPPTNDNWLEVF